MRLLRALLVVAALVAVALPAGAQSTRDTQRKLDRAKKELDDVAAERRRIEGQRGEAARKLRELDERVGTSTRALKRVEAELHRQQAELQALQARRGALDAALGAQRRELAQLLRAAYAVGGDAPLKLMLSQDRVADGNRLLAYHGYLQRDRARRIADLRAELAGLTELERSIADASAALAATRQQQQADVARLERDRKQRSSAVAELDQRYQDRRTRERALGRDVKGLQSVLAQLRAAARRAEAERKAAAAREARTGSASSGRRPPPPVIANAQPIRVGGLGWPLSGTLVTAYGGTLPDGRRSQGVLIAAPAGTAVQAVANGKVVFAEWMSGYGLLCIVDHGNGTMSLYANNDGLLRDAGSDVKRGDAVASVGNSGGQGQSALYFELRRNGQPVDPRAWLQKR
ncbi:peptidoglycan DD-metalloendopeptidase family protein [Lysobacter sp. M2-1]|uniref:murein hydrolase activator EnvC family protein n=1 Tax=Lysobacter sp. M2-1 TaxID=2916839 RepID=UPI0031F2F15F